MINTSEILPSPALAPFVRCYSLRKFNTNGSVLIRQWHAMNETSMMFFFKDQPSQLIDPEGRIVRKGSYGAIVGLGTRYNGQIVMNGNFSFFEILFRPTGFTKMFGIPSTEIINQIIDVDTVFGSSIKLFYEQLGETDELYKMACIANHCLTHYLDKRKNSNYTDCIPFISDFIIRNSGTMSMDKLANNANMSLRSFQRKFIAEVGVSPKLFSCTTRFNHALFLKLQEANREWTAVAMESGYFDQMHLIRDFKRFAGDVPSSFLKKTPLALEKYTSRVKI